MGGVALHDLVRLPLRAALRASSPERERDLRARVADSLHARALAGDLALTIDLADLVVDPAVRAGYSWDGGVDHHVTGPGPEQLAPDDATQAYFDSEPGRVLVARDAAASRAGLRSRSPRTPLRRSRAPIRGSAAGSRTHAGEKRSCGATRSASSRACRRC